MRVEIAQQLNNNQQMPMTKMDETAFDFASCTPADLREVQSVNTTVSEPSEPSEPENANIRSYKPSLITLDGIESELPNKNGQIS